MSVRYNLKGEVNATEYALNPGQTGALKTCHITFASMGPSYNKTFSNLDKNKLLAATQYLTGHCELNYHLNKYKPLMNISISSLLYGGGNFEPLNRTMSDVVKYVNRKDRSGHISQRHSRSASSPLEEVRDTTTRNTIYDDKNEKLSFDVHLKNEPGFGSI